MKRKTKLAWILAAALGAGTAGVAIAHGDESGGWGGPMMGGGMMGHGAGMMGGGMMGHGAGMMGGGMAGHDDGGRVQHHGPGGAARLDRLAEQLQLSDSQRPLWDEFRNVIEQQATARRDARCGAGATRAAATTPLERMQRRIDHMQIRLDGMRTLSAAFSEFFASLTPEQQEIVNEAMTHRGGHRGHGPASS